MTDAHSPDLAYQLALALAKIALLEQQSEEIRQQVRQQERQRYEQQLRQLQIQIAQLIEKQKLLIHHLFGQKSEGLTPKQARLNQETALEDLSALEQTQNNIQHDLSQGQATQLQTDETPNAETLATQSQAENDSNQTDTPKAKIKRGRRIVIPDNLEVRTIIHKPKSITCDCGCQMQQIGEDVQDKLGFIPKQFYRERHIYPKYACKDCHCQNQTLVQASTPAQIIDKSIATPELLAHILISKYADHQPLYRQNLIYQRSGVYLADSTMADWVGRCGVALEPLVKRLHEILLSQPILHADETPVTIMKVNGKSPKQGYVWAYVTPQHSKLKAVVYDFAESRRNEHPKAFLHKWQGQLVCDDYNGYKFLFNQQPHAVIEVGCMAHARRKFHELHVTGQSIVSEEALNFFQRLYAIEREIDELFEKNALPSSRNTQTVWQIRQAKAKPIADALHQWLLEKRQLASKNSAIARAIDYCLKRWKALIQYLNDGSLPIDNNWAENQMRPWALGRKNWLFAGSLRSGQRAAVIMSLIQSARLNGVDAFAYLSDVLRRLPTHKDKDIDELLPHVWQSPQ